MLSIVGMTVLYLRIVAVMSAHAVLARARAR